MTDKNNQTPLPTALPTSALESKLKTLREQSQKHSQALTQKLATSQSGQNLLHIGTSLSTLPPDLHSLLTHLHPLLSDIEDYETSSVELLQDLVHRANEVRILQRRMEHARECAQLYEDLQASEQTIQRNEQYGTLIQDEDLERDGILGTSYWNGIVCVSCLISQMNFSFFVYSDQVDHVHSLERAAHTTLCLVQDLTHSTAQVSATTTLDSNATTTTLPSLRTPLDHDSERAQFLMKLAPRIRRLESGTIKALSTRLESVLQQLQQEEGQEHDHVDQTTVRTMRECIGRSVSFVSIHTYTKNTITGTNNDWTLYARTSFVGKRKGSGKCVCQSRNHVSKLHYRAIVFRQCSPLIVLHSYS